MKSNYLKMAFVTVVSVSIFSCSKSLDELTTRDQMIQKNQIETQNNSLPNGDKIVFTQVVQLEGSQQVPVAAVTETKGIAILRVSQSKKLYSKVIIQKLAEGDVLRFAHVHAGTAGSNGPVIIGLADNAADFGINKEIQLTGTQFTALTTGAVYVNAHSNFFPGGIVRGQIR